MIVVLDEIALCETHAEGLPRIDVDAVYRDRRNGVVFRSASQHALYPALTGGKVIQRVGRKGVRPTRLAGHLPRIVQRGKLWHCRRGPGQQKSAEDAGVDSVIS